MPELKDFGKIVGGNQKMKAMVLTKISALEGNENPLEMVDLPDPVLKGEFGEPRF